MLFESITFDTMLTVFFGGKEFLEFFSVLDGELDYFTGGGL